MNERGSGGGDVLNGGKEKGAKDDDHHHHMIEDRGSFTFLSWIYSSGFVCVCVCVLEQKENTTIIFFILDSDFILFYVENRTEKQK